MPDVPEGSRIPPLAERRQTPRDHTDLRTLWALGGQLSEEEVRLLMKGARVYTCRFCSRVRVQDHWCSIAPDMLAFLDTWNALSPEVCPECLARRGPAAPQEG